MSSTGSNGETLSELPDDGRNGGRGGDAERDVRSARAVAAALDGNAGCRPRRQRYEGGTRRGFACRGRVQPARTRAGQGTRRLNLGGSGPEDVALAILSEVNMDRYSAGGRRATRLNLDDLVVVRAAATSGAESSTDCTKPGIRSW